MIIAQAFEAVYVGQRVIKAGIFIAKIFVTDPTNKIGSGITKAQEIIFAVSAGLNILQMIFSMALG